MSLKILNVAYPFAPVGPHSVGGAEQVLSQIDFGLARAGHHSIVVACAGSEAAGTLVETAAPVGVLTEETRQGLRQLYALRIREAMALHQPDVVHLHGIDCFEYLPPPGPTLLITLHLPPAWYPAGIWSLSRPDTYLHCVSPGQQRDCPPHARLLPPIENGVDVDRLQMRCTRRGFALALGRICPEKNLHTALEAGVHARVPVLLAGEVFPYEAHRRYFREEIAPRLNGAARFIGAVGFARKRRLLSAARCLLLPSLAPETSSLVAMEALACGTPVIAFPSGAVPDIVDDGVTGFLVSSAEEMGEAIAKAHRIDPRACRDAAKSRFALSRVLKEYMVLYHRLADGGWADGSSRQVRAPSRSA